MNTIRFRCKIEQILLTKEYPMHFNFNEQFTKKKKILRKFLRHVTSDYKMV